MLYANRQTLGFGVNRVPFNKIVINYCIIIVGLTKIIMLIDES